MFSPNGVFRNLSVVTSLHHPDLFFAIISMLHHCPGLPNVVREDILSVPIPYAPNSDQNRKPFIIPC